MMKQDIVLLLIGKTGSGKSATGNIIFNETVFESKISSSSVTRVCQTHTNFVNDRSVTVIDTPDFRFSTHADFDSDSELKRALKLFSPGAHAILLILPLNVVTEVEMDFICWFEQTFGVEALKFTLVLFTHADERHMRSLGELIRENTKLSDFINQCGQRYHEFNIKASANRAQVTDLTEKINRLLSDNTNSCYTLEMMQETERRREEEEMRPEEENRREGEMRDAEKRREEEERRVEELTRKKEEREYQIKLNRVQSQTEMRVRRECEDRKTAKMLDTVWKEFKNLFVKQNKLKYFCVIVVFSLVTGGVLMWRKHSLNRWTFIHCLFTGGLASTAGLCIKIIWRLVLKNQYVCSSSHERPNDVRPLLLKTGDVVCGAVAGAVIGHFLGGNLFPVTVLAGLAGAAAALTAKQ